MPAIRLIQLLKLLNGRDINDFILYLENPAFNERPAPRKLLRLLKKHHPDYPPQLDKQQLFRKVYPDEAYKDIKFRQLTSHTTKLLEQFMALRSFMGSADQQVHLLQYLREKEADTAYEVTYRQVNKRMGTAGGGSEHDRLAQWRILEEEQLYREQQAQKQRRQEPINFKKLDEELNHYYVLNKLKLYCDALNYRQLKAGGEEFLLMQELLNRVEEGHFERNKAVQVWYHLIKMLTEPDGAGHFEAVKDLLKRYATGFVHDEARRMYGMAQNYCIRKINQGEGAFMQQLFELYRNLLQQGLIYDNEKLSPWDFKNIVTVGLRLGHTNWVRQFIEEQQYHIDRTERENAYTYNLAKYHFETGDHDAVLSLLLQVEYSDLYYNLDSKVMLMKTWYELDEVDALFSFLDTFRIYVQRQKQMSTYHKQAYLKLIKFTKRLANLPPRDKARYAKLEKKLQDTPGVPDKGWLMKKLGELK